MESELKGSTDTARELGVTPVTLQRWAKEGRITPAYITPGGHFRWKLDDVRSQLGMPSATDD